MGVGNFTMNNTETLYLDHEAIYGEYLSHECRFENLDDESDASFYFEDLIDLVRDLLPKTYNTDIREYDSDLGVIIADNRFYQITIVDWHTYFAINVVLQDDFAYEAEVHPLAEANHYKTAISLFDKIAEHHPEHVRRRCCAWTSCSYTHSKAA